MPKRTGGREEPETVPVRGHGAMVLAVAPATGRYAAGLRLQEGQAETQAQQRKQQTGVDPAHKQMDCTSQASVTAVNRLAADRLRGLRKLQS